MRQVALHPPHSLQHDSKVRSVEGIDGERLVDVQMLNCGQVDLGRLRGPTGAAQPGDEQLQATVGC